MTISNKDEWWQAVDKNWDNLKSIIIRFAGQELLKQAEKQRTEKDSKLSTLFNDVWFRAPDQGWIRDIPGWFVLCDLCSESYVLHDGESMEDID